MMLVHFSLAVFWVYLFWIGTVVPGVAKETRIALVIGISRYEHVEKLKNTVSDARLLTEKLQSVGFEVALETDLSKDRFAQALRDFGRRIEAAGSDTVALFFYAGHGVQDDNRINYLVPADADIESLVDLPVEALPLDIALRTMEGARPRVAFAIVDACRDSPLPRSARRSARRGLALEDERRGQLIAFSTEPGKTALDGDGDHSPFADALAELIGVPGLEVTTLFRQVSKKVLDVTNQEQFPWVTQRLTEDFYFRPGAATETSASEALPGAAATVAAMPSTAASQDIAEIEYGKAVVSNTADAYETWLRRYSGHPRKPSVVKLLQRLAEEELWKQAEASRSRADSVATLDRLLISYPDGIYAEKAHQRQAALRAQEPGPTFGNVSSGPVSPRGVQRHVGMDAPGNDRGSWIRGVATLDACESICLADPGCAGYTYNGRRSTCIPKDRIGSLLRHDENPVTGVVGPWVGARHDLSASQHADPGLLSSRPLSIDEIEIANRLRRQFRQRYQQKGISGINVSTTLCYDQVRKDALGTDAALYCIALDLLASQVAATSAEAGRGGFARFNDVRNAYARATSIMTIMNIRDRESMLARARLIADQATREAAIANPKSASRRRQ
jgi:uncharacterized caspase-like protein